METLIKNRLTWIAHVDLDAFFASCEQRDHPEYRDRPVIVGALPGNRGVVAACSYEARRFGIHSAMPISEAVKRCPDAVYLRPNMQIYQQTSRQIMQLLQDFTPQVEKASIDEAYLDISGLEKLIGSPQTIGQAIRRHIRTETGLTASVGIGPNRLIAKLGSEACKPDGLKVIPQDQVMDFLAPLPVANLRGLGKQTLKIIHGLGIRTVAELRGIAPETLKTHVGEKAADSFLRQAQGIASDKIVTDRQRKSISKERTFSRDIKDPQILRDTLRTLAAQVAQTARQHRLTGKIVTLKIRYSGFETYTRQRTLDEPTHDERVILQTAWSLFNNGGLPAKAVRLIGTGISGWETKTQSQPDLFARPGGSEPEEKILAAIEAAALKFGKPMIQAGMAKKP